MRAIRRLGLVGALALGALFTSCKDEILVVVGVATVEVQGPSQLLVGGTGQFTAVAKDDRGNSLGGRACTWSVSNATFATVAQGGTVTGVLGGAVTVSASCEGKSGSASLTVNNPAPLVTSIDPGVVTAGGGGVQVKVLGSGFVATSVVKWNGSDRTTTYVSANEVRAAITAADLASAGSFQVTVFNPTPGGGTSGSKPLTVGNPVPVVTALTPDHVTMGASGQSVTITGTGFVATSMVRWNGSDRTTTYVSATELKAAITASDLAAPGWKTVTVVNPTPGGGESGGKTFGVRIPAVGPFLGGGVEHTCAIATTGTYCWGGHGGLLGDGSTADASEPVRVTGGRSLVAVAAKGYHACGLDEVGTAYCWGGGGYGQLGNGSWANQLQPVAVSGGLNFVSIAAGGYHSCGLTHDGKAYCWGWNSNGQLGDGSTNNQSVPVPVQQGAVAFKAIDGGYVHTCAVTTAGAVQCWGGNYGGSLGDGTDTERHTPVPVTGLTGVVGVAGGLVHSCAWTASGPGYCWGANPAGQLGDGSRNWSLTPVPVSLVPRFVAMTVGPEHTCGITDGGEARCWGHGGSGQLGNGTRSMETQPALVPGINGPVAIAAGNRHTCVTTSSGQAYCWGDLGYGQLGNGEVAFRLSPVPVSAGPAALAAVTAGRWFTCGASTAGAAHCWGRNEEGNLGDGSFDPSPSPVPVSTAQQFASLESGLGHTCGLTAAGEAYCWGNEGWGALGNGSSWGSVPVPGLVAGGHTFQSLGVGRDHTCGVTSHGAVYCWGNNGYGQLGDGNVGDGASSNLPVPVNQGLPGLTFMLVAAGGTHTCAISTGGSVYCWGSNYLGQLGDGTLTSHPTPMPVLGLSGIVALSLGFEHSCALDTLGKAYCWGRGGTLGNFRSVASAEPLPVDGGHAFRSIRASGFHTCAVTTDNRGYCWGVNGWGQLGNGTFNWGYAPVEIAPGLTWSWVGGGSSEEHTCGVTTAGKAYCWGRQRYGELGIGIWGVELHPVVVKGGIDFGLPPSILGGPRPSARRRP